MIVMKDITYIKQAIKVLTVVELAATNDDLSKKWLYEYCESGNATARAIKRETAYKYQDIELVYNYDKAEYTGGEIDALGDAMVLLDGLLNSILNGDPTPEGYIKDIKQQVLLDPADYDHLTGAWPILEIKRPDELFGSINTPIIDYFETIFNYIEKARENNV